LDVLGKTAQTKRLAAAGAAGGAVEWVSSLENWADVAEFILSLYIESITYRPKCKQFWQESEKMNHL